MQDIIKKYHKHKIISNIGIVVASLVMAVGINIFLVDGTNIGQNLKASVLNANQAEEKSDIYVEKGINDTLIIKSAKEIKNTMNISFSFNYNPQNIEIIDIKSTIGEITNIANTPGINSIILTFNEATNIDLNSKILEIKIKKKEEKTENLNIVNANFKDSSEEIFILSTSGIAF